MVLVSAVSSETVTDTQVAPLAARVTVLDVPEEASADPCWVRMLSKSGVAEATVVSTLCPSIQVGVTEALVAETATVPV